MALTSSARHAGDGNRSRRRRAGGLLGAFLLMAAACGGGGELADPALDPEVDDDTGLPFFASPEDEDAPDAEEMIENGPIGAEGGTEVEVGGAAPIDATDGTGDGNEGGQAAVATPGGGGGGTGGGGGGRTSSGGSRIATGSGGSPVGSPVGSNDGDGDEASDDEAGERGTNTSGDGSADDSTGGPVTTFPSNSDTSDPDDETPAGATEDSGDGSTDDPGNGDSDAGGSSGDVATTTTSTPPDTGAIVVDPVFANNRPPAEPVTVVDDFSDADQWLLYEQIIPGRPDCYELDLARATLYTLNQGDEDENRALALTANAGGSTFSNHALLGRLVSTRPGVLGPHRFDLRTMIEPGSETAIQTGPEFSVQISVRMSNGRYLTSVFGVQYVPALGDWQVFVHDEDSVGWVVVQNAPLTPGEWYDVSLRFNTDGNDYLELVVDGPGGFEAELDDLSTVWQDKGLEAEATWATVDVENLFTCDDPAVATATVYYDDIVLVTE